MSFFQLYLVIMKGYEKYKQNETNFKPLISNIKSKRFYYKCLLECILKTLVKYFHFIIMKGFLYMFY
jgi:hypothetical protein